MEIGGDWKCILTMLVRFMFHMFACSLLHNKLFEQPKSIQVGKFSSFRGMTSEYLYFFCCVRVWMHTFKNQQVINAPVMDHKGNRISLLPEIEREKSLEVDEFHVICLDIDFLMTV